MEKDGKCKLILISNDDGIDSLGIHALVDYMVDYGEVVVVAPEQPQSAKSSSLTVETPLRARQLPDYHGAKMWRVNGTPVDCTKLAFSHILGRKPDIVVSGINHGSNAGINAIYSGTMGVVFEACINGIPSVGFSLLSHDANADFTECENVVRTVVDGVLANGLPKDVCLNVNIPAKCKVKGIKVTNAAEGVWVEDFEKTTDPHGREIFWLTGRYEVTHPDDSSSDIYWLDKEYATVVPCTPDQTAKRAISALSSVFDNDFDV